VVQCLRSNWLTTGPVTRRFEEQLAGGVGAKHAIGLNSCTAALHLAVEALGLQRGQAVLVPTMTFAATAEIVLYLGGVPILVDCEPETGNMDLADAERKLDMHRRGELLPGLAGEPVGIIPVHVAGLMMDMHKVNDFATRHGLWVVEDAAHALPAASRSSAGAPWQRCGEGTAAVTCFSFYANKTITTGEGGMAVTQDDALAERLRLMALHGLSRDAWDRYRQGAQWDYRILAPGYKYNLTDIASALGIHQLARAEEMRQARERLARRYLDKLAAIDELELPPDPVDRVHSWHLFTIRLRLDRLRIDRNAFVDGLRERGIGFSVHWRPLHLHPYYEERVGWPADLLPEATREWPRRVSLPLYPDMTESEQDHVIAALRELCRGASQRALPIAATSAKPACLPTGS
jgi:dTDP-4-amino-4,6-dideoxygalactose transaminase